MGLSMGQGSLTIIKRENLILETTILEFSMGMAFTFYQVKKSTKARSKTASAMAMENGGRITLTTTLTSIKANG